MKTNSWLNRKHLSKDRINNMKKKFCENKPFAHLNIKEFLEKEKATNLLQELKKEKYYLEDSDLYQFERTIDFENSKNKIIQEFRKFLLSEEFIIFLEELTNTKIQRKKLDLHSLKLTNTHYLLCHDDQVQKRNIAFILNLSKNWEKENGGTLCLFDSKNNFPTNISKKIIPQFNQFTIFKVNKKSFHEIEEVIGSKKRISFSGWYY